ncbi:Maf-domain-containing protein [Cucurbitaria berberidis CBS 394.84]|uniref:Maf-domain-containing protein n=1 Tax=Cucurbitaria berberidis CBS 394.84 TaxID=1168544 RepID=A0A9P4GT73_9PLEO|nr:Maf-domain-containing protein [Cucurbitaria berberidis CBS 394.84]KAF1851295.1 Maf-domain-containing protein [Cucurbitaria berberidis CBS 394.84]
MSAQLIPVEPPPSYEDARKSPIPDSKSPSATPGARKPPPGPPPPLDVPYLNDLRRQRVVLASASPRRRQLLAQIGLYKIDICPSKFAEDLPYSLGALNYVLETASAKAMDVYKREIDNHEKGEPAIIISADTIIVSHDGRILEKPRGEVDHLNMLKMLRDQGEHKVMTAVAVMRPLESAVEPGYKMETHVEETTVKFDSNVSDELILAYVRTRDGNDKAGGYGIQTAGSILIERIEGSYDNVVGLPLRATLRLIEKVMEPEEDLDEELDNVFDGKAYED